MTQTATKPSARQFLLGQLRHPLKLRVILSLSMVGSWYVFFFVPLAEQTQATTTRIARERSRIGIAKEIESLKKTVAPYHARIPAGADFNELMRHVNNQLRSSNLKLIDLKPEAAKDLGPYQTIGIQLTLEGTFTDIDAFLFWIESAERYLRVDAVKLDPNPQDRGRLKAQLTLLSLAEKAPGAVTVKPAPAKGAGPKTDN